MSDTFDDFLNNLNSTYSQYDQSPEILITRLQESTCEVTKCELCGSLLFQVVDQCPVCYIQVCVACAMEKCYCHNCHAFSVQEIIELTYDEENKRTLVYVRISHLRRIWLPLSSVEMSAPKLLYQFLYGTRKNTVKYTFK